MTGATPADRTLAARCAEVLGWRKTGLLRGGHLKASAKRLESRFGDDAIQYAELDTIMEAMRLVAALGKPDDSLIELVARAICAGCGENPDHVGDARGNDLRWQDYRAIAAAVIGAIVPTILTDEQERVV